MQEPAPANPDTSSPLPNGPEKTALVSAEMDLAPAEPAPEKVVALQSSASECLEPIVPGYALLFFDHLYSEYLTLKSKITDANIVALLEAIHEKRRKCQLSWSDVYTFDLALVGVRPALSLIRKAYDARARYRSFAGQKEYDEYVASNPPNLIEIKVAPDAEPPEPDEIIANRLRADVEYLLSKFYLYYATLPARELLRDQLTQRAVRRTMIFVGVLVVLIFISLGIVSVSRWFDLPVNPPGLTVLTVALAGIVGGCVSTLQRIQSAPSEGDALFNLAALNNGWTGLSLSPVYGGIFASLLFVLFAAGVLKGAVFPEIHTPPRRSLPVATASPTPTPTPTPTPSPTPTPAVSSLPTAATDFDAAQSLAALSLSVAQATPSPSDPANQDATKVSAAPDSETILRVKTFLENTGPVDGVAYALLIVWSFLAGFAERLVPDTLNRLVAKNQAIQGQ